MLVHALGVNDSLRPRCTLSPMPPLTFLPLNDMQSGVALIVSEGSAKGPGFSKVFTDYIEQGLSRRFLLRWRQDASEIFHGRTPNSNKFS